MPPPTKILSGAELLKNLEPLNEKQALVINAKVFGTVDTDNKLNLSPIPNASPLKAVLVGYQSSFGVLDFSPVDLNQVVMLPIGAAVLVVFNGFAGVFLNVNSVLLQEEIRKGERMFSLKERALIVSEGRYGFAPIPKSLTDERDKIIANLRLENARLQQENTALRQQLGDVPNLRVQIETLKAMVAARDQEILTLKAQIQQMIETSKRTPDDFATAVSNSVDKLQTRLAGLTNPTSDFVVREFNLEAKVYIDVNEQGEIDYRFIRPGDNVDPQKVSNLALKLMPVPKQETAPVPAPDTPAPPAPAPGSLSPGGVTPRPATPLGVEAPGSLPGQDLPLESIAGLGADLRDRLGQNNIHSVAEFLQAATRARTIAAFSAMLDVDRQRLGNWVMQAQLMTLGGIDAAMAQALIDFGITSLRAMAGANAQILLAEYNAQAAANEVPAATLADVQRWIATAKTYLKR